MKLQTVQVIGLNTDQKAALVLSNSRNGDHYFLAVLILSSDDAFTKGRQILSELSDFYFDCEESTEGQKLTATFEEAKKKLSTDEFSIFLGAVSGKVLYMESLGEVAVFLKRAEKLSPLNFGSQGQLVSGFLQEGDRLLFVTQSLVSFLGEDLEKSLELPLESFEEEVADRVGASNVENQGLAALLVDVEPEVKEEETGEDDVVKTPQENIPNLQQEEEYSEQPIYYSDSSKLNPLSVVKKSIKPILAFLWHQKKRFPKSNRGRLILAIVLIVIIAVGVGVEVKAKKDAKLNADFNQAMNEAKEQFNGAKGLSTLNPVEAKGKLDRAKEKVDLALSLKPKNSEAESLKKQLETEAPSLLQQFSISEFPLFLDLDLIKKNFRPSQVSTSNGKILLLDPALKTLVLVDMAKKSNQILAGSEQLGDAVFASLNGDLAFVYSKDKGILKVDTKNSKVTTVAKKDEDFGEIKDIYSFAGNIYVLDAGKNQIWKYLPTSDGYSDKREYLTKTTKADFAETLRMQIESSVYILKKSGEVLRFTKGDKDNFSFEGLPSGVKDPKSLFISSETDNLYLLDSGNSRLLILTKIGAYKSQISGEKFAATSDLIVDEKGKKVYLLEGSKIFQLDLK